MAKVRVNRIHLQQLLIQDPLSHSSYPCDSIEVAFASNILNSEREKKKETKKVTVEFHFNCNWINWLRKGKYKFRPVLWTCMCVSSIQHFRSKYSVFFDILKWWKVRNFYVNCNSREKSHMKLEKVTKMHK